MKRLVRAAAVLLFPVAFCLIPAFAQSGTVTVSSAATVDSTGSTITNATVCFAPVTAALVPLAYKVNGKGQATISPICASVTNGAWSLTLADTNLTKPQNVCFNVTITDNTSGNTLLGGAGSGYTCVQPAYNTTSPNTWCMSGSCNFDNYQPATTALGVTTAPQINSVVANTLASGASATASVSGSPGAGYTITLGIPQGPAGSGVNMRGAWAANTAYAKNDVYTQSGTAYLVTTAYTSGSSYGSTDTANNTVFVSSGPGAAGSAGAVQVAGAGGALAVGTPFNIGATLMDAQNNFFIRAAQPTTWPIPTGYGFGGIFIGYQSGQQYGTGGAQASAMQAPIAIGYQAGQSWQWVNGSVAIGYEAAQSWQGVNNCGPYECGNFVAIGPFAAQSDLGTVAAPNNSTEFIAIGNKAYQHGNGEAYSIMIGAHIEEVGGGNSNVYVGPGISNWTGTNGVYTFLGAAHSVMVGDNIMLPTPATTGTSSSPLTYTPAMDTIVGSYDAACWQSANYDTILGAYIGGYYGEPSTCTSVGSQASSVYIAAGGGATGVNFAPSWTGGAYNVVVTSRGYGYGTHTGGGLTTGNGNVIVGPGAGAAIAAGGQNVIAGNEAAPAFSGSLGVVVGDDAAYAATSAGQMVAIGHGALAAITSGPRDTALGYGAGSAITTNGDGTYVGYQAGSGDTAQQNTYIGSQAGQRAAATNLANVAIGFRAFYSASGGGAESHVVAVGDNSGCTSCTSAEMLGASAQVGAVTGAAQIGNGTNSTANTMQFQSWNFLTSTGVASFLNEKLSATQTTLSGTTAGSVIWSQPEQGASWKVALLNLSGYENTTATAQTITLPASYTAAYVAGGGNCTGVTVSGATVTLPASMSSTQSGVCEIRGY